VSEEAAGPGPLEAPEPVPANLPERPETGPERPATGPERPEAPRGRAEPERPGAPANGVERREYTREEYERLGRGEAVGEEAPKREDRSWRSQDSDHGEPGPDDTWWNSFRDSSEFIVGDNATMIVVNLPDGREATALRYHRSWQWVRDAERRFVEVPGHAGLLKTLGEEKLLYLCAAPGTGRRFLAERLLALTAGEDRVYGVHLPTAAVSLVDLAKQADLMVKGAGVVLELAGTGPVTPALLDTFAGLARDAGGYLVILDDRTGSGGALMSPYEARPEPPDPVSVLKRHLRAAPPRSCTRPCGHESCSEAFITECLAEQEVQERLTADPKPAAVADLARTLAGWDPETESLTHALSRIRAGVRKLASALVNAVSGGEPADPRAAPRGQAVQIAYATFTGYPLADVFEVVQPLFQFLWMEENGEATPSRMLFDGGVEKIMKAPDGTSVLTGDHGENPRRVHFRDARLPVDILDVVWNDFDGVRRPLQIWLRYLVETGRLGIRRRAASVSGSLLSLDFHQVWRVLINPWARSGRGDLRQAAALALDTAAGNEQLLGLLRSRVRDWTRSANSQLHDTAARAYGTRLGASLLGEALTDLRVLAGRNDLNHSASVARAMQYLYAGTPVDVWGSLADWMSDDRYRVQVHAARSLILIAALSAEAPRQQWPRLLADLTDIGEPDLLTGPWRAALAGPTTSLRAWQTWHSWLRRADTDEALRHALLPLGRQILAEPLTTRGRFYLGQWSRDSESARRLLDEL
jgi:hypothetical protein